jgi:hypothetical protein
MSAISRWLRFDPGVDGLRRHSTTAIIPEVGLRTPAIWSGDHDQSMSHIRAELGIIHFADQEALAATLLGQCLGGHGRILARNRVPLDSVLPASVKNC